jgi:tetratricopeptide (TPR) repeat protein
MNDLKARLAEGIRLLKAGQRQQARALLTVIVTEDEENELAWLWLSGAVDSVEDRRVCLENVLALNPDNQAARQGLARLGPAPMPFAEDEPLPIVMARSAAERDAPFRRVPEAKPAPGEAEARIITGSERPSLPDVWSSNVDICAYCAQAVSKTDSRCPQCRRSMLAQELLYPVASKYHTNLLIVIGILTAVSTLTTGLLLYLYTVLAPEILAELIPDPAIRQAVYIGSLIGLVGGLAFNLFILAGLYFRQVWAYWFMILVYSLGLLWTVCSLSINLPQSAETVPLMFILVCVTPFILYYLFVLYTIWMAGPDFKRVRRWQVVDVNPRLKEPEEFDRMAKELARQGKWAAAVAHWRHAAGRAPGQWSYLQRLAQAYARLGFYQRSLDSLATALEAARDPQVKQGIAAEMRRIEEKLAGNKAYV